MPPVLRLAPRARLPWPARVRVSRQAPGIGTRDGPGTHRAFALATSGRHDRGGAGAAPVPDGGPPVSRGPCAVSLLAPDPRRPHRAGIRDTADERIGPFSEDAELRSINTGFATCRD